MKLVKVIAVIAASTLVSACSERASDRTAEKSNDEGAFSNASVYPLADGCAYVQGGNPSKWWYVCGTRAAPIKTPLPEVLDVFPLANGDALANDATSGKLYLLHHDTVEETVAGDIQRPPQSNVSEKLLRGFSFVSASSARRARAAEQRSEPEPDNDYE